MNIRPANPSDVPAIGALEYACPTAAHWSQAEYARIFQPGSVPRVILVAEDPALCGFIVARAIPPDWEIENIAVAPERRKSGIGLALLSSVTAQAHVRRAEAVVLEVRASNAAARALYRRAGFLKNGERPAYYANPIEDAVLYRLDLRHRPPAPGPVQ